jgi:hypothetical protein
MKTLTGLLGELYLTESINSTKFEMDLTKAINEISSEGKSRATGLKYQSKAAEVAAKSCVKELVKKIGKPRLAWQMAGRAPTSVITAAYTEGGPGKSIKSGEPKTDIVFLNQSGKKYCSSVKNGAAAQIASAQTNEIYAVLNATFGKTEGAEIAKTISNIIIQTGNETVYKQTRKKFETKYGKDEFDRLISVVTGLKSGTGVPFDRELEQINEFLDLIGVREKITIEMTKFMLKNENRKKLLREFATGEKRFNKPDFIATHFLEWFDDGSIKFMDADEFIDHMLPRFKFGLRDRGRKSSKSGGGSRGIAFRLDFAQKAGDAGELDEAFDGMMLEQNYEYYMQCFNEGLGDWLKTAKQNVVNAGMKGYQYVKEGFKKFVEALRKVVSIFAAILSRAIRGLGLGSFLDKFGLQPTEMRYTW